MTPRVSSIYLWKCKIDETALPNISSSSWCNLFWTSSWAPMRKIAQLEATEVVSWPYQNTRMETQTYDKNGAFSSSVDQSKENLTTYRTHNAAAHNSRRSICDSTHAMQNMLAVRWLCRVLLFRRLYDGLHRESPSEDKFKMNIPTDLFTPRRMKITFYGMRYATSKMTFAVCNEWKSALLQHNCDTVETDPSCEWRRSKAGYAV